MKFSSDSLYHRLTVRKEMANKINAILDTYFEFDTSKKKLPRGWTHQFVADQLKLKLNNNLCLIIREQVKQRGVELINNTSKYYYRNIKLKEESKIV